MLKIKENKPGIDHIDTDGNFLDSKLVLDNKEDIEMSYEIIQKLEEFTT